ncbi:MAG: uroporphyrinogen-III C-methyltransferase [Holophagales bacterium]|nr:uroporphyrinogen-III C-methyltransferase [Holophagales bacterium]
MVKGAPPLAFPTPATRDHHPTSRGIVHLVGAGPGDPELITVRGLRRLGRAEVVVYDRLTHPDLLAEAPSTAELIYAGKAPGRQALSQEQICRLLVRHARAGRRVVRLKGGDPFVFGRGGEEAAALARAGVPYEVVPAITSAVGVPAAAGIPLTHRGVAASFAVVTGHRARGQDAPDWRALARIDTLVILMGVGRLRTATAELLRHGRDPATPAAIVEHGTLADERVLIDRLDRLADRAQREEARSPAAIVVGEVVSLRADLLSSLVAPHHQPPAAGTIAEIPAHIPAAIPPAAAPAALSRSSVPREPSRGEIRHAP